VPVRANHRLLVLTALAALVGLIAGGAAWLLLRLIGLITNLVLFHQFGWTSPSFTTLHRSPLIIVAAVVGGLLVSLLALWSPVIRGHGIPEAMEAVLTKHSRIQPRTAVAKPLSAAISIGTGGPFGAEGPIIVTGGAIGSLIGQLLPMTASERKILLASGAAAGMSATFGTPLAAVVLVIELLLFEFSTRAFIPLVVASAVAGGVHAAIFGSGPFFAIPDHRFSGLGTLPAFAVLGLAAGLLAVIVAKGLFVVEDLYRRLPVHEFWHPVIGAAAFASVGLIAPRSLGVGYDAITDVLSSRLALSTVAVLATVKLVAWWLALGSGTSGGTLAPLLLISAGFGSLFGAAANNLFPTIGVSQGAFALVAMAAVFGAATRASFASIIFVFELTGDYKAILPLMVATVMADLVAESLLEDSLMTEKLSRRGLRVHSQLEVDPLRTVEVREVMSPVTDDLVLDADVVTVADDDVVHVALERMLEAGVELLPVVHDGHVVGVCTPNDIIRARAHRLDHERVQPGWLTRTLKRSI
jgi:CIC family chloride channel protein